MADAWQLQGTVFVACNCDYGCPCNFNALPTQGKCEGQWTWHVAAGRYGDTVLDGLSFTVAVNWPGAIHEGNGHALILVDERAAEAQRNAIETLIGGDAGGPWGVLAWTWPTIDGPHAARYDVEHDGVNWRLAAGDFLQIESETIQPRHRRRGTPTRDPARGHRLQGRSLRIFEAVSRRQRHPPRLRGPVHGSLRFRVRGTVRSAADGGLQPLASKPAERDPARPPFGSVPRPVTKTDQRRRDE
jgi:hypothetical protein